MYMFEQCLLEVNIHTLNELLKFITLYLDNMSHFAGQGQVLHLKGFNFITIKHWAGTDPWVEKAGGNHSLRVVRQNMYILEKAMHVQITLYILFAVI